MPRNGKLAYLLKTYPKLSETFILNEILGLEKLGMKVEIFSLRQPSEPLHAAVKAVKAKVTYIPHIGSKLTPPEGCRGILAHLYFLASRTSLYLRPAYFCLSE